MILDYDTLRLLHWGILFACLLGFVIFEGTSLGGCLLLPLLDKQIDQQKILNTTSLATCTHYFTVCRLAYCFRCIVFQPAMVISFFTIGLVISRYDLAVYR